MGIFVVSAFSGDVGGSAKKVGKRIKELERIYGIEHGGNRNNQDEKNSSCRKTQSQLASDMGMDVRTLQNYKMLADMIPELSPTKKTPPELSPLMPCVSVFTTIQFLQSQYKDLDRYRLSLCL